MGAAPAGPVQWQPLGVLQPAMLPAFQPVVDHMGKGAGKGKGTVWDGWGSTGWDKNFGIKLLLDCLEAAGAIPEGKCSAVNGLILVKGLPPDATDLDLYKLFSPFGPVSHVRAFWNDDRTCKGYGFVHFLDANCADMAIKVLHNTEMSNGTTLTVEVKEPRKPGDVWKENEEALLQQSALLHDQMLQQQLYDLQQQQQHQEQQAQMDVDNAEKDEAAAHAKAESDEAEKKRRLGLVKKRAMDVIRGSHLG